MKCYNIYLQAHLKICFLKHWHEIHCSHKSLKINTNYREFLVKKSAHSTKHAAQQNRKSIQPSHLLQKYLYFESAYFSSYGSRALFEIRKKKSFTKRRLKKDQRTWKTFGIFISLCSTEDKAYSTSHFSNLPDKQQNISQMMTLSIRQNNNLLRKRKI